MGINIWFRQNGEETVYSGFWEAEQDPMTCDPEYPVPPWLLPICWVCVHLSKFILNEDHQETQDCNTWGSCKILGRFLLLTNVHRLVLGWYRDAGHSLVHSSIWYSCRQGKKMRSWSVSKETQKPEDEHVASGCLSHNLEYNRMLFL